MVAIIMGVSAWLLLPGESRWQKSQYIWHSLIALLVRIYHTIIIYNMNSATWLTWWCGSMANCSQVIRSYFAWGCIIIISSLIRPNTSDAIQNSNQDYPRFNRIDESLQFIQPDMSKYVRCHSKFNSRLPEIQSHWWISTIYPNSNW